MAIIWAVSNPLQSDAPLPKTRPSAIVALKGGNRHLDLSSTGTTSVWDINISPALPDRPSMRAIKLPLSGSRPRISDSMPSSASQSLAYSATAVSFPVGMNPVFTEGIRTRACSNAKMSSSAASTWAYRSFISGMVKLLIRIPNGSLQALGSVNRPLFPVNDGTRRWCSDAIGKYLERSFIRSLGVGRRGCLLPGRRTGLEKHPRYRDRQRAETHDKKGES